jgi:hypothetical protein
MQERKVSRFQKVLS